MRLVSVFAALAVAFAAAAPLAAQEVRPPRTVAVSGHGEVTGAPDTAFVTSGVTTHAPTAREALDANTAAMNELIEVLTESGIAARDIQTSNFMVNPNYVYPQQPDAEGYSQPPRIVGYIVSNNVTVRVRNLDSLGAVLDRAVSVGANTINGVNFTLEDPSELYDRARELAFRDARAKAELYAGVADVALGDILAISETQGFGGPQPYMMRGVAAEAAMAVPVQAGELTFAIDVTVSWEIDG